MPRKKNIPPLKTALEGIPEPIPIKKESPKIKYAPGRHPNSLAQLEKGKKGWLAKPEAEAARRAGGIARGKQKTERKNIIEFMDAWLWSDRKVERNGVVEKIPTIQALIENASADKKSIDILKLFLEYTMPKAAQKIELSGGIDNVGGMTTEQRDKLFDLIKAGKLG